MHTHYAFWIFIAGAAAAALYLVYSRYRSDPLPEKGGLLDRLEGTVRLRDLYLLAAEIERQGAELYDRLALLASDEKVRALCARLAADELDHLELIRRQLDEWDQLPPNRVLMESLLEQAGRAGIFASSPGDEATEEVLAAYAITQEAKTAEFYAAFEKAFPRAWKRAKMHELVLTEREHERDLRAAYPEAPVPRWRSEG